MAAGVSSSDGSQDVSRTSANFPLPAPAVVSEPSGSGTGVRRRMDIKHILYARFFPSKLCHWSLYLIKVDAEAY